MSTSSGEEAPEEARRVGLGSSMGHAVERAENPLTGSNLYFLPPCNTNNKTLTLRSKGGAEHPKGKGLTPTF